MSQRARREQRLTEIKLLRSEQAVLEHLADVWNAWAALPDRTGDDDREFRDAIHRAQLVVAFRVARRADPHIWRQA